MKTMKRAMNENTDGTHFQGKVNISYQKLVELFGEPIRFDNYKSDDKSDAEWVVKYGDDVFTIYNWKDGINYAGEFGKNVEDITNWYIGGNVSADDFVEALKNKKENTIQDFADLVQKDQKEYYAKTYPDQSIDFWEHSYKVQVKPGNKYTKVDVGCSGKYMVVNSTGEIFGIKAYGVIHKGHCYGTLETMNDWNWGGYRAMRKR